MKFDNNHEKYRDDASHVTDDSKKKSSLLVRLLEQKGGRN